jgi:lysophospholipase L1-like esterase
MPPRRAPIALWKRLVFGACASVGLWLTAEAAVTVLYAPEVEAWGAPPPSPQRGVSVLVGNPYLIYEYPPGVHQERGVKVTINRLGLRGPEVETPKPPGRRRFLTTGDSSVFGFGVADDEVFSSVAARALGDGVEPVIGAVPGYSTFQTLNLLRMRALATEPDLIVVGNLWSDNNFDSFVDKDTIATLTGYESSVQGAVKRLFTRSAIFRVADWKLRVRDRMRKVEKVGWQTSSQDRGQIGLRRVEINDYAQNLEHIAQIARSRGAELVFLLLSNNEDLGVGGDQGEALKAWTPYREVMRETAARHGAPVIDVPELFRASGLAKDELFLDQMHPTARGHALIGEALSSLLAERGWPTGGAVLRDPAGGAVPTYEDPFLRGGRASLNGGAAPSGPAPGAPPGAAAAGPSDAVRIEGVVRAASFDGGVIHMDIITPGELTPTVLNTIRLDAPGPFVMPVGVAQPVILRVYIDSAGDGPGADDRAIVLSAHVFRLDEGPARGVIIDLDAGTVTAG